MSGLYCLCGRAPILLTAGRVRLHTYDTVFHKKLNPLLFISSYLCFSSHELHENFQKYIGDVAYFEHGINIFDSLTNLFI